jgi:hypothetical protein
MGLAHENERSAPVRKRLKITLNFYIGWNCDDYIVIFGGKCYIWLSENNPPLEERRLNKTAR